MTDPIQPGLSRDKSFTVTEEHAAAHVGSGSMRVLATPWMIAFIEITARQLLDDHLPDEQSSVGTHVDVRHLAACPIGVEVVASVKLTERDGNRLKLNVSLKCKDKLIGQGQHQRFIIDTERFMRGLEENAS